MTPVPADPPADTATSDDGTATGGTSRRARVVLVALLVVVVGTGVLLGGSGPGVEPLLG